MTKKHYNITKNVLFGVLVLACLGLCVYLSDITFNSRNTVLVLPTVTIIPKNTSSMPLSLCESDDPNVSVSVSRIMSAPDDSAIKFATCDGTYHPPKQARTHSLHTILLRYTPENQWKRIEFPYFWNDANIRIIKLYNYRREANGMVLYILVGESANYLGILGFSYYKSYDYGESWQRIDKVPPEVCKNAQLLISGC